MSNAVISKFNVGQLLCTTKLKFNILVKILFEKNLFKIISSSNENGSYKAFGF